MTTYLGDNGVSKDIRKLLLHHTPIDVIDEHYDFSRYEGEMRAAWQLWADHVEKIIGRC